MISKNPVLRVLVNSPARMVDITAAYRRGRWTHVGILRDNLLSVWVHNVHGARERRIIRQLLRYSFCLCDGLCGTKRERRREQAPWREDSHCADDGRS